MYPHALLPALWSPFPYFDSQFPPAEPPLRPIEAPPQPPVLPSHSSLHPQTSFPLTWSALFSSLHSPPQPPLTPPRLPLHPTEAPHNSPVSPFHPFLHPQTSFPPHRSLTSSFLPFPSPSRNPPYPLLESCRRICRRSPREVCGHPGGSGLTQKSLETSQVGFGVSRESPG